MPPKMKFHGKSGKMKALALKPATEVELHDRQFEVELCWCIQQLELSLQNDKLTDKQAQESKQILKVLQNKSQPVVRKRQLMRMHFGDYRSIMAKAEKKSKKVSIISFTSPEALNSKSLFVRKSSTLSTGDNSFKFDFKVQSETDNKGDENNSNVSDASINIERNASNSVMRNKTQGFQFSDSEFKFNFNVENNV